VSSPVRQRHGITVPFEGISLPQHREVFRELVDLGFTDVWSAESGAYDAFTPLVLAAAWAPELRVGTAIIPAYTRGAMTLASQVASLCAANPGHFAVGIGSSSNIIVERWIGRSSASATRCASCALRYEARRSPSSTRRSR
jgi:alkanesulfonate monooxygenase SsuD/methylene tetrahydromethanopterin reductase-like flavin-dependent oxidoreductase (luciferase family)